MVASQPTKELWASKPWDHSAISVLKRLDSRSQGDSSVAKVLATQTGRPKFRSPAPHSKPGVAAGLPSSHRKVEQGPLGLGGQLS